ncbi:MAG: hypothetical protein ACOC21_00335 [Halanaerobiales bacterium]
MKKGILSLTFILLLIVTISTTTFAGGDWAFEVYGGTAYNIPTPLTIEKGEKTIDIDRAKYSTNPLEESPYYAWRVSRWENEKAWELQLVHHKIRLENDHEDIDHFEISHGYNLISVNHAWEKENYIFRGGLGTILTHPEFDVFNEKIDQEKGLAGLGFYFSGIAAQTSIGRKFELTDNWYASTEGMLNASYASVKPDATEITAKVPNVSLHFLLGMGYEF